MKKMIKCISFTTCLLFGTLCFPFKAEAQAELMPWGDLTGIRIQGQLMEFKTNLNVVGKDWSDIKSSGKELQRPRFTGPGSSKW